MPVADVKPQTTFAGWWILIFPLTYLVHIAEEYWGGEGFYQWLRKFAGAGMTAEQFLSINSFFMIVMIASMIVILAFPAWQWLLNGYGALVFINSALHVIGSCVTMSYSPGAVSGVLLWMPLGVYTIRRAWHSLPRERFWFGLSTGIVMHAMVSLVALTMN